MRSPVRLATIALTGPDCESKRNRHNSAATTVGIDHGTRTAARTAPRPRKARFMARARKRPRTSSSTTVVAVKNRVCRSASRKRPSCAIAA